jgi:hypothetical protein
MEGLGHRSIFASRGVKELDNEECDR